MRIRNVNLAKTKNYSVLFVDKAGTTTWESGWDAPAGKSNRLMHFGSGILSMSADGTSGTISTEMLRYIGPIKRSVHVKASWRCV